MFQRVMAGYVSARTLALTYLSAICWERWLLRAWCVPERLIAIGTNFLPPCTLTGYVANPRQYLSVWLCGSAWVKSILHTRCTKTIAVHYTN